LIKANQNNTNIGQAEILSIVNEMVTAMNELKKNFKGEGGGRASDDIEITALKAKVTELESVLKSFDGHITDIKGEVKLIPGLHKTMKEIVYVDHGQGASQRGR